MSLPGFAKMFHHSWKEELEHGEKLIEYGLMRGAKVSTPSVAVNRVIHLLDILT
jgi:ferritin